MHFKMSSAKWRPFCLGLIVYTLAPHGTRPSSGTILTIQSAVIYFKSLWLSTILNHVFLADDIIQNVRRNLGNSRGTSTVNLWMPTLPRMALSRTTQIKSLSEIEIQDETYWLKSANSFSASGTLGRRDLDCFGCVNCKILYGEFDNCCVNRIV